MKNNKFLLILAAFTMLFVGCGDENGPEGTDGKATQSDLVGKWGFGEKYDYEFKADGTYAEVQYDGELIHGKWSLTDNKLTLTPNGGVASDIGIILTGGKAWLVFVDEGENGGEKYRYVQNFRKIGATVDSGKLTDGRWDAPRWGARPSEYTEDTDYTFCMIVTGKTIDLYVLAWGMHIQGTFTLSDGRLTIETDKDHIWKAIYIDEHSIGWNAWGPPGDPDEYPNWDYTKPVMNPETFAVQAPYTWQTMTELYAKGKKPNPTDPEYIANPFAMKFIIYEFVDNEYNTAMELCGLDMCIMANGKEGFGGLGPNPYFYKR